MYAKRREDILAMLKETSPRSVKEIAESLLVSEMTVRRDLTQMEREGLVKRSFGTASLTAKDVKPEFLQAVMQKASMASEGKRRIAAAAAALVRDGDALILDVGTTVYELAKLVQNKAVTIHTSSIPTALCANGGTAEVRVSGGRMERTYEVLNGPAAESFYRNLYCDFVFVSAAAVSLDHGLTAYTEDDAALKRIMLSRGKTCVLLADSRKFGAVQKYRACGLEQMNIVITDAPPAEEYMDFFANRGIRVIVAEGGKESQAFGM